MKLQSDLIVSNVIMCINFKVSNVLLTHILILIHMFQYLHNIFIRNNFFLNVYWINV